MDSKSTIKWIAIFSVLMLFFINGFANTPQHKIIQHKKIQNKSIHKGPVHKVVKHKKIKHKNHQRGRSPLYLSHNTSHHTLKGNGEVSHTVTKSFTPNKKQNKKTPHKKITKKPIIKKLWNLNNVTIRDVIDEISSETGKNFLIDPRVKGNITIVSNTPIGPKEAYQVFLSALQISGFSVVKSGAVYKVVPNVSAKQLATRVANPIHPGVGDELVVRVVNLDKVSAERLVPIIRPLLSQWGIVSAYSPTNSLIISGRASNIKRMVDIINRVDMTDASGVDIIPLHYANATALVKTLMGLESAAKSSGQPVAVSLAADERSNSILLSGPKNRRLRMRVLIAQMDTPSRYGTSGNTQVVYLHYLQAKNLAPLLTKVAQSAAAASAGGTGKDAASKDKVNITAETNTNAIIITAPPTLMRTLKTVIAKLDIRPAQVLVQAVIAEVNASTAKQLGIQWGQNGPDSTSATTDTTTPGDFGDIGGIGIGVIRSGTLRGIVNALATDTTSDILSTPSVVVLDNQVAKISVGQMVPFTTGSYANTSDSSTVTPFTTTSREQVGLHLNVTPQINTGNSVKLLIDQGNESISASSVNTTSGDPTTNNSSIKTTVLVDNGQILVLGGLISNDLENSTTRIPIVSKIPVVGNLFKYKNHTREKKNLMIFIRPVIMHDKRRNNLVTEEKYHFIRSQQQAYRQGQATRQTLPMLPSMGRGEDLPMPFTHLASKRVIGK